MSVTFRRPLTLLIIALSLLMGGWSVFDGAKKLLTGLYVGEDTIGLGPWSIITSRLGISPEGMSTPFVFLGILWLVNCVIVLLGIPQRYGFSILVSLLSLFYLVPGTLISIVTLALALRERKHVILASHRS